MYTSSSLSEMDFLTCREDKTKATSGGTGNNKIPCVEMQVSFLMNANKRK